MNNPLFTTEHRITIVSEYVLNYSAALYRAQVEAKVAASVEDETASADANSRIEQFSAALSTVEAEYANLLEEQATKAE